MQKYLAGVGTLVTLVAMSACGSVPQLTYFDDLDAGATTPSTTPDATVTPPKDAGAQDASAAIDTGPIVQPDAGCGNVTPEPGFTCCSDVLCKGSSCDNDVCKECPGFCPLPFVCCEKRNGPGGGRVGCLDKTDCR